MNAKMLLIHYPYGLRIVCVKSLSEDFIITKLNEHDYEAKSRWDKYVTVPYDSEEYKIVLHPLSQSDETSQSKRCNSEGIGFDLQNHRRKYALVVRR